MSFEEQNRTVTLVWSLDSEREMNRPFFYFEGFFFNQRKFDMQVRVTF